MKTYSSHEIKVTIGGKPLHGITGVTWIDEATETPFINSEGAFIAEAKITMTKEEHKEFMLALFPRTKLRKRTFVSFLALTQPWAVSYKVRQPPIGEREIKVFKPRHIGPSHLVGTENKEDGNQSKINK